MHKTSTRIVRENQTETVCVENLTIAGMLKNHQLARAIADVIVGELPESMIHYKCARYGKNYVEIGRFQPSSAPVHVRRHQPGTHVEGPDVDV